MIHEDRTIEQAFGNKSQPDAMHGAAARQTNSVDTRAAACRIQ